MGREWGASGEIICHHPVTRTSPQIPKAPNLDNPSIRELTKNFPRAEQSYFGNIIQTRLFLSNPTSADISMNSYPPIILSYRMPINKLFIEWEPFPGNFFFTLYHSKLMKLLNKIIHNSKFIDIKVETLTLNECTYTNR